MTEMTFYQLYHCLNATVAVLHIELDQIKPVCFILFRSPLGFCRRKLLHYIAMSLV